MSFESDKKIHRSKGVIYDMQKRATVLQYSDHFQTVRIGSYKIPRTMVYDRMSRKVEETPFDSNNSYLYSVVSGDILYEHLDPTFLKQARELKEKLIKEKRAHRINTFWLSEAEKYKDNESYVYPIFNGLPTSELVHSDPLFPDARNDICLFENANDLMRSITSPGMALNEDFLIDMHDMSSEEDKRETVNVTEVGMVSIFNIANTGLNEYKLDERRDQTLYFKQNVEWYFPWFNQKSTDPDHWMLRKVPTGKRDYQGRELYHYVQNELWLKRFRDCQYKSYRDDKRYGLLYRAYDEEEDAYLIEEYNKKISVLDWTIEKLINLSIRNVTGGLITNYDVTRLGIPLTIVNIVDGRRAFLLKKSTTITVNSFAENKDGGIIKSDEYKKAVITEIIDAYRKFSKVTQTNPGNFHELKNFERIMKKKYFLVFNQKINEHKRRIFGFMKNSVKPHGEGLIYLDFNQ